MRSLVINGHCRTSAFAWVIGIVLLVAGLAGACGEGDVGRQESGRIQVSPATVSFPVVSLGDSETRVLEIRNTGSSELRVFDIEFEAKENATIDNLSIVDGVPDEIRVAAGESETLEIEYAPEETGERNDGTLRLYNSDPSYGSNDPLTVDVTTRGVQPELNVDPSPVRFPRLPPGERMTRTVTIQNFGNAPLELFEPPTMTGDSDFRVVSDSLDSDSFPATLAPLNTSSGDGERGDRLEFELEYAPTEQGNDEGELLVRSNENPGSTAEDPTVSEIEVNANADAPCLLFDRTSRNLGAVPLGGSVTEAITVENCGSETLEISSVAIAENSDDDEFSLDLGEHDEDGDGVLDEPVELDESGDQAFFAVTYEPESAGADEATIVFNSNDPAQNEAEVDLLANGREGECPTAEIRAKVEGNSTFVNPPLTVAPLDTVVLDGSGSEDPDGEVVDYQWRTISKPEDSTVRINPVDGDDEDMSRREFRVLTAGTYEIGLQVEDNDGFTSCEEATAQITAIPNEKIHVELTWTNPEDPDETDDTGSDVDVHMVKMGPGSWFEEPYDVYFRNKTGDWNPESPSLDIDDQNGRGPENIQLDNPVDCQWYAIGVHYWEQRFGTAYATIRIYINENLVFENLNTPLTNGGQFWDVARIHWPSGQVYGVNEVSPAPPQGQPPEVTGGMESSGLCTGQELY